MAGGRAGFIHPDGLRKKFRKVSGYGVPLILFSCSTRGTFRIGLKHSPTAKAARKGCDLRPATEIRSMWGGMGEVSQDVRCRSLEAKQCVKQWLCFRFEISGPQSEGLFWNHAHLILCLSRL